MCTKSCFSLIKLYNPNYVLILVQELIFMLFLVSKYLNYGLILGQKLIKYLNYVLILVQILIFMLFLVYGENGFFLSTGKEYLWNPFCIFIHYTH